MTQTLFRVILIFILSGLGDFSHGQESGVSMVPDSLSTIAVCPQKDIFDILTKEKLHAPEIPSRKVRAIILPLIAFSPATRLQIGAGSSLSWTIGRNQLTNLSAGSVQLLWTQAISRGQIIRQTI